MPCGGEEGGCLVTRRVGVEKNVDPRYPARLRAHSFAHEDFLVYFISFTLFLVLPIFFFTMSVCKENVICFKASPSEQHFIITMHGIAVVSAGEEGVLMTRSA